MHKQKKELLAVLFSLEQFGQYVYGRKVLVCIDHKPLEIIAIKPLSISARLLQQMLLRMQR